VTARPLVTIEEARHLLSEAGAPLTRTEVCALRHLHGRVLAHALVATGDVPGFARSAMDGFAVRAADTSAASTESPARLRVVDEAWAGHPARGTVAPGTAIAIATGGVIPEGADAVVMVEDTSRHGDEVSVRARVETGHHVSPRGSDLPAGVRALEPGDLLTPARVGVVAALGLTGAEVYSRPVVAILSSGDEVVEAGAPLGAGQVHDVNSHTLSAIVAASGGAPVVRRRIVDRYEDVEDAVRGAARADLVLVSGGSSVGGRDYVLDVLARLGDIRFRGIAVKPGKPTVLAVVDGKPVIGMPGNPTSCLSNGYLLVAPLVRRLARLPPHEPRVVQARLSRAVSSPPDRHQFYTVRVGDGIAEPAFKGSGDITSMARADGYFEIPVGVARVDAGETVDVTLF